MGHSDISITAKIYTHLLYGDLKVQDEVRLDFDKRPTSRDIKRVKETEEEMAMVLAQTLTSALADSPAGKHALMGLIQKLSAQSGKLQLDSTMMTENDVLATLMLRRDPATVVAETLTDSDSLNLPLDSEALPEKKMEPMIRIHFLQSCKR